MWMKAALCLRTTTAPVSVTCHETITCLNSKLSKRTNYFWRTHSAASDSVSIKYSSNRILIVKSTVRSGPTPIVGAQGHAIRSPNYRTDIEQWSKRVQFLAPCKNEMNGSMPRVRAAIVNVRFASIHHTLQPSNISLFPGITLQLSFSI